jgi:hypothetical protein
VPKHGIKNREAVKGFLAGRETLGTSMNARMTSGGLALFSFEEPIALRVGPDALLVEVEWKYSLTTASHRKLLLEVTNGSAYGLTKVTREEIRSRVGLDPTAPPPRILSAGRL